MTEQRTRRMLGKNWNQKLLDDLEEGKSELKVEVGDTIVVGTYMGLERNEFGRWFIMLEHKGERRFASMQEITKLVKCRGSL